MYRKLILLKFVLISACLSAPSHTKEINLALSSAPSNMSPFNSTDANSQNLNRLVYLSLVDVDQNMNFECRACESYTETVEDVRHTIRFKLREDLRFHNGEKLVARHVLESWQAFLNEENQSVFKKAFSKISSIIVHSDYDLSLVYENYDLENLTNLVLLKIFIQKDGELIGSGPYRISELKPLEIKLNAINAEDYPNFVFKVVRDETTLALKLLNGEVDLSLAQISPRKLDWLLARPKSELKLYRQQGTNTVYLSPNHRRGPLADLKVRQALSHLIPREDLAKHKLKNSVTVATGFFSESFSGVYLKRDYDSYDPPRAYQFLTEAGYLRAENGRWQKNGQDLSIDWKVSNNRATIEIVETIKHFLENHGFVVNLTIQEWGIFMRSLRTGQFDLIISQWLGFTGPEMLGVVFHSKNHPPVGANRGFYSSSQFDLAYDKAIAPANKNKAREYFRAAHEIAVNDYAYIDLWHPEIRWIGRSCIDLPTLYSTGSFLALLELKNNCKD